MSNLMMDSSRISVNMPILNTMNGYRLRLANGQEWYIISTKGLESWVEKLASIIGLDSGEPNGCPKLIFTQRQPARRQDQNMLEDLHRRGWKSHDLRSLQVWSHDDIPDVICEFSTDTGHDLDMVRMWRALHPIYQRAQRSGGLPVHAALVECQGIGALLAAPRSTGKSTCCRRLPPPWQALCDDETLIVRDNNTRYLAHPFPTWSDYLRGNSTKRWNVQRSLPLSAIFFLEPAETDGVVSIGQGLATTHINQSAIQVCRRNWKSLDKYEERAYKLQLFENACELAKAVPTFKLRVSLNGRFWEEMENILS